MPANHHSPNGHPTKVALAAASARPPLLAVVIEDDPLAVELLMEHLRRLEPPIAVAGCAATVPAARSLLQSVEYDVVFLDSTLVGGDGFELIPDVRPEAAVIFVTGHTDHAARAFEVNAVDYIVKPVTPTRLAEAIRRLAQLSPEPPPPHARLRPDDQIFLRGAAAGGRFTRLIDVSAILSSENYSEVLLADGERWFIRRTLLTWEALLPLESFQRVHRTAIVNLNAIERIDREDCSRTLLKLRGVRQPVRVSREVWRELRVQLADRLT